mgnify:CR=1 FL=1
MKFKDMAIYQIYPKSFQDTDGDGIGDLNGIRKHLSYLEKLGVDCLWITPFFPSHQYDNGYDVDDYCAVNPDFGTMEIFEDLVKEAEEHNLSIMLDMVFNHTSVFHEWFQKALAGDKYYQDFYYFRKGKEGGPPTNWISKFGGNAWEYVEDLDLYYLHLFHKNQADLNWHNPNVRNVLKKVIEFWIDKGVKGFRFDVINLIGKPKGEFQDDFEGDGRRFYTDGPYVNDFLKELVRDTRLSEMITVGEMSSTSPEACIQYTNPSEGELNMVFSFHHLKVDYPGGAKWKLMDPDIKKLEEIFTEWQLKLQDGGGWSAWFWNNHDQPRAVSRFGDDQKFHNRSGKMLANVVHFLRGTPYIYQGEEFGMTNGDFQSIEDFNDVESINYYDILQEEGISPDEALHIIKERSRDNGRTPVQWNGDKNAGFTTGKPWVKVNENYREINAEKALEDPDSLFYHYQKLIRLRKKYPVISEGLYIPAETKTKNIFTHRRKYKEQEILAIHNFSKEQLEIEFDEENSILFKDAKVLISNIDRKFFEKKFVLEPFESSIFIKAH